MGNSMKTYVYNWKPKKVKITDKEAYYLVQDKLYFVTEGHSMQGSWGKVVAIEESSQHCFSVKFHRYQQYSGSNNPLFDAYISSFNLRPVRSDGSVSAPIRIHHRYTQQRDYLGVLDVVQVEACGNILNYLKDFASVLVVDKNRENDLIQTIQSKQRLEGTVQNESKIFQMKDRNIITVLVNTESCGQVYTPTEALVKVESSSQPKISHIFLSYDIKSDVTSINPFAPMFVLEPPKSSYAVKGFTEDDDIVWLDVTAKTKIPIGGQECLFWSEGTHIVSIVDGPKFGKIVKITHVPADFEEMNEFPVQIEYENGEQRVLGNTHLTVGPVAKEDDILKQHTFVRMPLKARDRVQDWEYVREGASFLFERKDVDGVVGRVEGVLIHESVQQDGMDVMALFSFDDLGISKRISIFKGALWRNGEETDDIEYFSQFRTWRAKKEESE